MRSPWLLSVAEELDLDVTLPQSLLQLVGTLTCVTGLQKVEHIVTGVAPEQRHQPPALKMQCFRRDQRRSVERVGEPTGTFSYQEPLAA